MKRIGGWLIAAAVALLVVRVLFAFSIQPQAYESFVESNGSNYAFEKVKITSINNMLTKYTASWKALDVLSNTYEGHHMIESAEYVAHDNTWYLVARDVNMEHSSEKSWDILFQGQHIL